MTEQDQSVNEHLEDARAVPAAPQLAALSWCIGEIRESLTEVQNLLETLIVTGDGAGPEEAGVLDTNRLAAARMALHQAYGALAVVEMPGATVVVQEAERLLDALESGTVAPSAGVVARISNALTALPEYLDDLLRGAPDQPLYLYPAYRALLEARDADRIHPADLFFPRLTATLSSDPTAPLELSRADLQAVQTAFEHGLLKLLREAGSRETLAQLHEAIEAFEKSTVASRHGSFWTVVLAYFEALRDGVLELDVQGKRLIARINMQLRRTIGQQAPLAEGLLRDALFALACAQGGSELVARVRSAFALDGMVPADFEIPRYGAIERKLRARAGTALNRATATWDRAARGQAGELAAFVAALEEYTGAIADFGIPGMVGLAQACLNTGRTQSDSNAEIGETLGVEVAMALLFSEAALEAGLRDSASTDARSREMAGRITAIVAGDTLSPMPSWLHELAATTHERRTMAAFIGELLVNLRGVEKTLDAFFRDPGLRPGLATAIDEIRQVGGALRLLDCADAAAAADAIRDRIGGVIESEKMSDPADCEELALDIGSLGFFIEDLRNPGREAAIYHFDGASGHFRARMIDGAGEVFPASDLDAGWSQPVAHALAPAQFGPQSYGDNPLESPSGAVSPGDSQPVQPAVPEIVDLSQGAIDAAFDSELLQVFLAEAHEVLETIEHESAALADAPADQDRLTNIRRSFHTLKGSSRMVGLGLFGEAAWAVEQVFNLWVAESRAAGEDLLGLAARARAVFSSWLEGIEQGVPWGDDAAALMAAAGGVRDTGRLPEIGAAAAPDEVDGAAAAISSQWSDAEPATAAIGESEESEFETIDILEPVADIESHRSLLELGGAEFLDLDANGLNVRPIVDMGLDIESVWSDEPPPQGDLQIGGRWIREELYKIFLVESDTILATLAADADEWHLSPLRAASDEAHRCVHTLKGSAGVVGLDQVHEVAGLIKTFLASQAAAGVATNPEDRADYSQLVERLQAMLHQFAAGALPGEEPETLLLARTLAGRWQQAASSGSALATAEASQPAAEPVPDGPVCVDEFDADLLPVFVEEAEEWLPAVGEHLRDWLNRPQDRSFAQSVMRALHTVKGGARMAGAMTLGQLVHELEANVEAVASPDEVVPERIEALIARHDELMVLFEIISKTGAMPPEFAAAGLAPEASVPTAGEPHEAEAAQDLAKPGAVPADASASQVAEPAIPATSESAPRAGAAQPQQPLVRVRADVLDDLVNQAGEVSIARSRIDNSMGSLRQSLGELAENVARLRSQLREIEIQAETQIQARLAQQRESDGDFDPLEFDRFTRLQELTRMLAESVNDVATVQQGAFRSLDEASQDLLRQGRVLRELQHDLMRVRMVPFGSASDRMYRVVRQTAKQLGKRVTLEITGGGVELDRGVLERMAGPIEHLLRNSVAHGIEPPATRAAADKPETGEITIEVRQEGNEVMLLFADDGAGLNFERIRERAVEAGLARREQLLNDATLAGMILMPGFSTQTEVNEISGRGVGLNVVDEEVSALGGRITIESGRGTGTRFTIHLPLTLAISQVVIVTVGPLQYAVPSTSFEQVLQLRPQALAQAYEDGSIEWQDARVPLYYLATLVDAPDLSPVAQHYSQVVVLHSAGQRIAVHVDSVGRNQEVVVKNVGRQVSRVRGVSGATVMGNGDIVLILNPGLLAQQVAQGAANAAQIVPATPALAVAPPTVMVVDDSLTVRKVTQRLLSREGFEVLLAKDGLDALHQTEEVLPDVFLVDIEMPRMDGFDLTSTLRSDPRTAQVPIVMITSRTAEKHRGRALELGVDVFLGKPYRDEELLGHIRRLIKAAELQRAVS